MNFALLNAESYHFKKLHNESRKLDYESTLLRLPSQSLPSQSPKYPTLLLSTIINSNTPKNSTPQNNYSPK